MSEPDYWNTLKGIWTRIADIAHYFVWGTLNASLKEVIVTDETIPMYRKQFDWVTFGDFKVCPFCERCAAEGPYDADDLFMPEWPGHDFCRCILNTIIIAA